MNNKAIALAFGFIMMVLPLASAGIIYNEETMSVSTIAGVWKKQWEATPDSNWTAPPVQFEGQNMYFGQSGVGTDYPRSMAVSDDGMFGAVNYGQSGPGSEFNKYQLQSSGQVGDEEGRKPLAMSDDGRYIMVGEESGAVQPYVYFFSTETGPVWNLAVGGKVKDIDLTNDGEYGVACGQNTMGSSYHSLYMFSRENNSVIWDYDFDSNYCFAAAISDDGRYIVAGELDGATSELIVYDHQQQSIIWQKDMPSNIYDVAISGDGDFFVVGLGSGIVGNEFLKFTTTSSTEDWGYKTSATVHHTQVSYDQTAIAMMDFGGYVYYFTPSSGTPVWTDTSTTNRGQEIGISDDGNVIVAVRQTNGLAVYGPTSATPLMQNSMDGASSGPTGSVDVSGNGKHIVAFDSDQRMYIWSDGGNGWSSSDSAPIWSESGEANDVVISSGGYYGYSDNDDQTLNYGKIPVYSNTYHHDTPIYDEIWGFENYPADYEAIGDLEGLWLLDEGKGTTTKDHSGNGNDATFIGTPAWSSGKLGSGLNFDGTNDGLSISTDIADGLATMSAFIWFNTDVDQDVKCFFSNGRAFSSAHHLGGWDICQTSNDVYFDIYTDDGVGNEVRQSWATIDFPHDGEWHQAGFVFDNGALRMYLDSVLVQSETTTYSTLNDPSPTPDPDPGWDLITIGQVAYAGPNPWEGSLDEAVIYSDALSPTDVSNLYAISHDRMESGLMGHWRMEEGTGSTVADLSGNGNTAAITGASWDTGYFGNGLDFDGVNDDLLVSDSPELSTTGGITVSHWIKQGGSSGSQTLTVKQNIFVTEIWANNDYGGYFYPGGVQKQLKTSGIAFPENEWHLLTLTFDSGTCIGKIYRDGVFIKQDDWSGSVADCTTPANTNDIVIGKWPGNIQYFNGVMDELQLWSRALSASEITDLYNLEYHGDPTKIDSAQNGRYILSRTQSGDGGGGIAFFDTTTTPLATPSWTANVGPGSQVALSDNANPMTITGNLDGTVRVFNSTGVEKFNHKLDREATAVAIEDDNSYAYASSLDHYVYGWDLDPLSGTPAWSRFVGGPAIDMAFDGNSIAVVTNDYLINFDTAGVEQWRDKLQDTPFSVEFEGGRILITYATSEDSHSSFREIENDADLSMYYKPGVPVGLWTFDEGTGTTVEDRSGNGNTGTLNNGAHFTEGILGGGVELDGVNDDVNFGRFTELDGADKFTVSGWFKFDSSLTHDSRTLWKDDSFGFYMSDPDHCRAYVYYDGGDTNAQGDCGTDVIEYTTDSWIYFTMTYDGTTIRLYRDAIEIQTQALADKLVRTKNTDLIIYGSFDQFEGSADEIAIYRTDLSALEITQLYEDTRGRVYDVQSGLRGYWPLDDDVDDYSGNGNDGVITGAIPGEGHVGGAYEFDGVDDFVNLGPTGDIGITLADPRTLSFWIKLDECTGAVPATCSSGLHKFFMSFGDSGSIGGDMFAPRIIPATDTLGLMVDNTGAYNDISCSTIGYEELEDKWNHITYTYDGDTTVAIYMNGEFDCSGDTGIPLQTDSTNDAYIGARNVGGSYSIGIEADIDEVAIWDRALNTDEIKTIFYKDQAQFQSGLLAFYPFNKGGNEDHSSYYNFENNVNKLTYNSGGNEVSGKIGDAVQFDNDPVPGVGSHQIAYTDDPSGVFGGHYGMTWNTWLNPDCDYYACGSAVLMHKDDVNIFYVNPTQQIYLYIYLDGTENGGTGNCNVANDFAVGKWSMLTVTYDAHDGFLRGFIDGVEMPFVSSGSGSVGCDLTDPAAGSTISKGTPLNSNTNDFCISGQCGGTNLYNGDVDEVGVWSRALSSEEIGELYNSRTHTFDLQVGYTLHTSTGERLVMGDTYTKGFGSFSYAGSTFAEDGTMALLDLDNEYTEIWEGTLGTAASFDGKDFPVSGDEAGIVIDNSLDVGTELTLSAWVEGSGDCYRDTIISRRYTEDGLAIWNACTDVMFSLRLDGVNKRIYSTNWLNDRAWHHIAGTWDGSTMILYIDGVEDDTLAASGSITHNDFSWSIGRDQYSGGNSVFKGPISDVRSYNTALSATEIATLAGNNPVVSGVYTSVGTPNGWWKLDEDWTGGATTAVDSSGNSYDGTRQGNIETYYNNMQARYAVFDGVDDYVGVGVWDSGPQMSISVWFRSDWTAGTDNILGRYYGMDSWNLKEVGGNPRLSVRPYTGGVFRDIDCYGFQWGEWTNAVLTGDGTTFTLYLNGAYCGTSAQVGTFDAAGYTWELGLDGSSTTTNLYEGATADVRFYETTISQADITALAGTNPATTGNYAETFSTPVRWWKLNDNAEDSSSNGNEGSEIGDIEYQHITIKYTAEDLSTYTNLANNENTIGFGRDGSTLLFGKDETFSYYDSLGNGWQSGDMSPSWSIKEQKDITAVHADGSTTSWGTADGNTVFKSPGLHPLSANLITFWNLASIQARPVYSITADRISNNGTWWAGEMAVGLDGSLYFESIYDMDNGQQGYIFYKYNVTGSKAWEVKTDTYGWFKKSSFSSDSRSSMDVATNGSVLVALDDGFAYISAAGTPTFLGSDYPNFPTGVVGPGQCMFLGDTGEIAFTSRASGSVNEYFVYNIETKALKWQFNSEVTAFQLDSSNNGNYIIFTNGTQMLFKSADANTLFTKAVADVKASSVANNGYVGLASSTKGWFIYDQTGKTVLSGTGEDGDRYYDIDMDLEGMWFAVAGYNVKTGSAFMEIWSLDDEEYNYPKFTRALREEKTDDDGDLRSYRVKMGEGSIRVLWAWSGSPEAGAMEYQLIKSITLIQIVEKNIAFGLSTVLVLLILFIMLKFFKDFTGKIMAKWTT